MDDPSPRYLSPAEREALIADLKKAQEEFINDPDDGFIPPAGVGFAREVPPPDST